MSDTITKLAELAAKPEFPATLNLIKMIRNGNKVKRYHTVDTLVPETVGHHSANVAHLVMSLEPRCGKDLIVAALCHDLAEQYTGDIPATAKWASAKLAAVVKEVESSYMGLLQVELTDYEKCVLKQADMLDLCFKCYEEFRLGNKEVVPIIRRGIQFLREGRSNPLVEYVIKEIEYDIR